MATTKQWFVENVKRLGVEGRTSDVEAERSLGFFTEHMLSLRLNKKSGMFVVQFNSTEHLPGGLMAKVGNAGVEAPFVTTSYEERSQDFKTVRYVHEATFTTLNPRDVNEITFEYVPVM